MERMAAFGNKADVAAVAECSAGDRLTDETQNRRFRELGLPHLDAAYNLARWLARNDDDARDIVQEAYLRAFKAFAGFHGVNARPWLLAIVRNTCYTWLSQHRSAQLDVSYDEESHGGESATPSYIVHSEDDPEAIMALAEDRRLFDSALDALPIEFREVVILRDIEDMSYKEIAGVAAIPIGTVMSRLARGRRLLLDELARRRGGGPDGL
jgi:RNA polymerase sigma-70 factor (ECF subfamily)